MRTKFEVEFIQVSFRQYIATLVLMNGRCGLPQTIWRTLQDEGWAWEGLVVELLMER